jgi:hypothetical protein
VPPQFRGNDFRRFSTNGDSAPFRNTPCKIIALRQIRLLDQDHSRPSEAVNQDAKHFQISDEFGDLETIEIDLHLTTMDNIYK